MTTPAIQRETVFTGYLSGTTGPVSAGTALLYNAAGTKLIVASDANRTATGRVTACIALEDGDNEDTAIAVQFVGPLPRNVLNLGDGAEGSVYVDSSGSLTRSAGTDIVGECDADGTVYLLCGGLYGGGGGASPGGVANSIQANNGSGGLTGYSTALVGNGYIALGSDPSILTTGLNVSYGYFNGINSNNSADNDQVNLISLRDGTSLGLGTDLIQVGAGSYNVLLVPGSGRTLYGRSDTYSFSNGNAGTTILTLTASAITAGITQSVNSGNSKVTITEDVANLQSTDGTAANLYTFTIPDEAVTCVDVLCTAVQSTGGAGASYKRTITFRRDGGTVSTIGSVRDNQTDEDSAAWDFTVDNSGSTGRVRITGAAATTIQWGAAIRIQTTVP